MVILGINAYHADSSAAIFVDGKMIAAIEEERFRRVKHWAGFPELAVAFCLKEAGIGFDQVDHYAIGRDPKAKFFKKLLYLAKHPVGSFAAVKERFSNSRKVSSIEHELSRISGLPLSAFVGKIKQVEHHRSHIASAFFASPFEEAACLSIDGSGDFSTTMLGIGKGNSITIIDSVDFPHSAGIFYTAFTQLLGFPHYGDEYKVMGMAPYGEPKYLEQLADVVKLTDDGLFKLNLSYFREGTQGIITYGEDHAPLVAPLFSEKMVSAFGQPRKKEEPLTQYHKDLAASVQRFTEQLIFHLLTHLHKRTGLDNICIAGGVAQNSVANGKILRNTPFKNIYIPSAGHDAGISMGAALYTQHVSVHYDRQPAIRSAYTGSRFTNEAIKAILNERQIAFEELPDAELFDRITNRMINGGVVGWFSGRAEFGPRALGGRSIIADPRRADAKEILNLKIKRRESFRPFAPSILKEYVAEYFEVVDEVPFMEKVFPIKKEKQALIPAVTHVDGTGRLQTVDADISPRYYGLIEAFRKKTGIPILLNTSFNENEPIVNSPAEALDCYLRTNMDMLVMENVLVERLVS
ncbi:MAG: carbamoyltransferase [Chitinophagaceae bacterium]|nr:carbamoyltransferase [Chitinophagaceae bacterium]